ncbi:RNA polymerase sigma factor SigJ [Saccharopolyspora sp. 5N708]|uniref:RNA polymerase sigma factor SigJ n=1 Tax=Saccharopolyspora sp. 5N708 TaxID=3457424 RepID=UPI003FCEFDBD
MKPDHDHLDDDASAVFQRHRPVMLGVAYRMLGSFADAEDVVQEAWLRWADTDWSAIEVPRRFLITVVTRLAIDRLRLAHRNRETYVGPWLPEPVRTQEVEPLGPADTAAQRDTLSLATLRLMHRLSAPERAVFVLREAFELPYEEIGEILGLGEAHARQLYRRGAAHLATDRDRFPTDPSVHRALVERFLHAARTGDRTALQGLLAQDVTLWGDGGGKARAALRPVSGAERVSRFLTGTIDKYPDVEFQIAEINGQAAVLVRLGRQWQVCAFEISCGLVTGIQWMSNPDKLTQLAPADQRASD